MNPDFQFVGATRGSLPRAASGTSPKCASQKMSRRLLLPTEAKRYGSKCNVASAHHITFVWMLHLTGSSLVSYSMQLLWQDTTAKPRSSSPCGNDGPPLTSCLPVVRQSRGGSQPPGLALLAPEHTSARRQRTSLTPAPAWCDSWIHLPQALPTA